MTEQELLNELGKKFTIVKQPEIIEKVENIHWMNVNVLDKGLSSAIKRNITYYVEDKGTAKETAYYKDKPPITNIKEEDFKELLIEYISDLYANKQSILLIDSKHKFAIINGLKSNLGVYNEQKYLIKYISGKFSHKEIK